VPAALSQLALTENGRTFESFLSSALGTVEQRLEARIAKLVGLVRRPRQRAHEPGLVPRHRGDASRHCMTCCVGGMPAPVCLRRTHTPNRRTVMIRGQVEGTSWRFYMIRRESTSGRPRGRGRGLARSRGR
jgi:hypothetical protein